MMWPFKTKREKELEERLQALIEASKSLHNRTVLIDIQQVNEREGRFLFSRAGELVQIEFMLSWGANIEQWKKELL